MDFLLVNTLSLLLFYLMDLSSFPPPVHPFIVAFLIQLKTILTHHLFIHARNVQSPANPKQNQPAMSWCASVRRTIPPASDAANMKDQENPGTVNASPSPLLLP